MESTIEDGDIILSQQLFAKSDIQRYDIINAEVDEEGITNQVIKRVIGLPGESVTVYNSGAVAINGMLLPDECQIYKKKIIESNLESKERIMFQIELTDNQFYVLGDNREWSTDSRVFGPVEFEAILSIAKYRIYPFRRIGNDFEIHTINNTESNIESKLEKQTMGEQEYA